MSGRDVTVMGAPLVGRSDELRVLSSMAAEASEGALRVCLVSGPPGVGKTALVRAFVASSATSLWARWACGDEEERHVAYGIADQLGLVARGNRDVPEPDPVAVGSTIVGLFSADTTAGGGVCWVIDDVHWADALSLQALSFALRRLRADPVLIVVVCRQDAIEQLPHGLARLVADNGRHLTLEGLGTDGLVQLSATLGPSELTRRAAERLGQHTGGNPLHAITLMNELDPDVLESSVESLLPAPRSFSSLIVARVGRCTHDTQALLCAAAVLGQHAAVSTATRLAGLTDPSPSLDEAVNADLLSVPPPGHHVTFVHPLIRAAIYHDLPPGTRSGLHAHAAELLDDESTVLRHRVAASTGPDTKLARDTADLAERRAAWGDWAGAAELFGAAASLAVGTVEREQNQLRRIESLLAHGGIAEAGATAEAARQFAPSPLRDLILSQLALFGGAYNEAALGLRDAWNGCRHPEDDHLAARIAAHLAHLAVNAGRGEETVSWARETLALGRGRVGSDTITVLCLGLGELGRAHEGLAEIAGLAPTTVPGTVDADTLVGRGILQLWTDDLAGAQISLGQAETQLGGHGPLQLRLMALFYLADAEYRAGRWDEAVLHSQLAVSLAQDADQAWTFALVHAVAAFPLAGRGHWAAAQSHTTAALDAATNLGDGASIVWSSMAQARLAQARSDHQGVLAALKPVADLVDVDGRDEPGIQPWKALLVEALIGLRRYDDAETNLQAVEKTAEERAHATESLRAARLRGLLLGAQGRHSEAQEAFAAARHADPQYRSPLEAALLDAAQGSVLRKAGKRRAAAAALNAAISQLGDLHASSYLESAQREAAACGLTPRSRRSANQDHLTPREHAVATLITSGMTNRQAATELVVSQKTVEYHLRNIYTKLGVNSRTALTTYLLTRQYASEERGS